MGHRRWGIGTSGDGIRDEAFLGGDWSWVII